MNAKDYVKKALRTETDKYSFPATGKVTPRIEHAIYGLVTEAGEMMDALKKSKIYGKDLDTTNLIEEAGDLMWYLSVLSDDLDVSFEDIWEINIKKLTARYPDKYSHERALNRDLDIERKILEKK
jgi:NTP pyrophosphatase (non-canonical NTP hydrolase)